MLSIEYFEETGQMPAAPQVFEVMRGQRNVEFVTVSTMIRAETEEQAIAYAIEKGLDLDWEEIHADGYEFEAWCDDEPDDIETRPGEADAFTADAIGWTPEQEAT